MSATKQALGGRASLEDWERECVRLQQHEDPELRAQGRLRATIGRQVIEYVAAERDAGRTAHAILDDLMRFVAIERGTACSLSGLSEAQTMPYAESGSRQFKRWVMWGWLAGENRKDAMRGVVGFGDASPTDSKTGAEA